MPAMSETAPHLRCDVLVIGAGPAGSACAQVLARAGLDVLLCDRQVFPRDKVCGDGLIADAHRALARLGLLDAVLARATHASRLACHAPRAGRLDLPATLAVLPRRELDELLRGAAVAAGARWLAPVCFERLACDAAGRVNGARLLQRDGEPCQVSARWTVLATGADARALEAAGMCDRRAPSGMALRGYVQGQGSGLEPDALQVVWHRALRGGYGWIFPAGAQGFNVGVGYMRREGHEQVADAPNLRDLLATFARIHPPAQALLHGGVAPGRFKGAPLRCSLDGARKARPGLLVAGEAAGSTYLFTGEGIGKAMESGLAAAAAAAQMDAQGDAGVCGTYERAMQALRPRFAAYALAHRFNERPWMVDLIIWRARHNAALRGRLAGVLDESEDPGRLASARGLLGAFLRPG